MDQAQLLSFIGSLFDKLVADVSAKVESRLLESIIDRLNTSGMLTTEIDTRIEAALDRLAANKTKIFQTKIIELSELDKSMVLEIVRDEIENNIDLDGTIEDWMSNNFDINTYIKNQLNVSEEVDDYLSDHLTDMVKDEVRELSFSVSVD